MSKVLSVAINELGRDFICSDLHGHYELLEHKMAEVNFNPEVDRIFSLGDLIDRGPNSLQAFSYISKPWFYSIMGNHEVMMIDAIMLNERKNFWHYCGGDWAKLLPEEDLRAYCHTLLSLPLAIEIPISLSQKVGLIHANLPVTCDWRDVVKHLSKLDADAYTSDLLIETILWAKFNVHDELSLRKVLNIEHVFHGHTVKSEIQTFANRTFMDLGSYCFGEIGFLEIKPFLHKLPT